MVPRELARPHTRIIAACCITTCYAALSLDRSVMVEKHMRKTDRVRANQDAKDAWNQNAKFWDERMGEGNDFVEVLIWPVTDRLLALKPGERVLDIACGNGLTSRRMAAM